MENMVSPWLGRRVFLTGHTGFKGGWLALWLNRLGAQVRGYALNPSTTPNFFTAVGVGSAVEDVRGNILDQPYLQASMREFAPEVVFHLAAQPLVRRSYVDPVGTYATNVLGTVHVLEAVRKIPSVRAVLNITTDKCYENREWVWPYRETDSLGGYDPYSSSKACAEIVSAAFRSSFFSEHRRVALATARAGNVIGGGDWSEDRLIPDLVRSVQSGQPVLIRRPHAIRPWQHVLEPVRGYLMLAERLLEGKEQFASAFNFGPGDESTWTVAKIANYVTSRWSNSPGWKQDTEQGVHEAGILRLDTSKARAELGWRPRLTLESALDLTVSWHQAYYQGQAMKDLTLSQIETYSQQENR